MSFAPSQEADRLAAFSVERALKQKQLSELVSLEKWKDAGLLINELDPPAGTTNVVRFERPRSRL